MEASGKRGPRGTRDAEEQGHDCVSRYDRRSVIGRAD